MECPFLVRKVLSGAPPHMNRSNSPAIGISSFILQILKDLDASHDRSTDNTFRIRKGHSIGMSQH